MPPLDHPPPISSPCKSSLRLTHPAHLTLSLGSVGRSPDPMTSATDYVSLLVPSPPQAHWPSTTLPLPLEDLTRPHLDISSYFPPLQPAAQISLRIIPSNTFTPDFHKLCPPISSSPITNSKHETLTHISHPATVNMCGGSYPAGSVLVKGNHVKPSHPYGQAALIINIMC